MRNQRILVTVFTVAAFAVGCKPADTPLPPQTNAATYEDVKRESREAAAALRDYSYAQKSEFTARMKAEIAELNREIDTLSQKIETSTGTTREEAKVKLHALRERTAHLDQKLEGVKDATESSWDEVKSGVKKGYEEVKDSFREARQWLNDKLAS